MKKVNLKQYLMRKFLVNDLKESILNIQNFPSLYPNITEKIKRCVLHRFPYSIFYSVKTDCILILSVAHQHRKPYYWIDRIE